MTRMTPNDEAQLRTDLLQRLAGLRPHAGGGMLERGPQAFTYGCLKRERIAQVRMPHPVIGVVLRGSKEVWLGGDGQVFDPGTVFVLPRNVALDVVNVPDAQIGLYESLLLEMPHLPPGVAPLSPDERQAPARPGRFALPLTRDLVEALGHAGTALTDSRHHEAICAFRMAEALTLLRTVAEARPLFEHGTLAEVAWLVRSDPARAWDVAGVAAALGIGGSTLRRRLSAEGQPFRQVLRETRMAAAQAALQAGAGSTEAALTAGYSSRSHFSRAFRQTFGTTPAGRS